MMSECVEILKALTENVNFLRSKYSTYMSAIIESTITTERILQQLQALSHLKAVSCKCYHCFMQIFKTVEIRCKSIKQLSTLNQ